MEIRFDGKNKVVAIKDGKKLGYIQFNYAPDKAKERNVEFKWIYVNPKHRRKGIATEMIKFFMDNFKGKAVWLSLWTSDWVAKDKSHKLYTKLGFKKMAYQADYYEDGVGTTLYAIRLSGKNRL